jgi:hypothetical protein
MPALASIHWTGPAFLKFVRDDLLRPRLDKCGGEVLRGVREQIDAPKHGTVWHDKQGRRWVSSAEGEAVASPTGHARKSFFAESGMEGKSPSVRIGTNDKRTVRHVVGLNKDEGPRDPLAPALKAKAKRCIAILKGQG